MISEKTKSICRYLKKIHQGHKKPELFINLTYNCPLRCKFCYVNYQRNNDFSYEDICYIFDEVVLKVSEIKLITFFGGEPLLKIDILEKILEKYYDVCCQKNIHISVITSMSVNIEKYFDLIKKYPLFETVISFDNNAEQRVYANNKPFKVLEHIDLNDYKKYNHNICFHTVIDNEKSLDDLILLQEIYKEYGFPYSWCWNKTPAHTFDFKEKYKSIIQKIIDEDSYYPTAFNHEIDHYLNRTNQGCGIGSEMFISASGDISPCSISHHNNEFLLMKNGIIQNDSNELIQTVEQNVFNNNHCEKCFIKGFCNGGCLFERKRERNDYNSVNEVLCQIMKQLYEVYNDIFSDLSEEKIQFLQNKIIDNSMGNIDYCYNRDINIDMYDYFDLKD